MTLRVLKAKQPVKFVAPIINFSISNNREEKICPICGRKFIAVLEMKNPSPEQGVYCSHACMGRAAYRKLGKYVSQKDVNEFIKSKEHVIRRSIYRIMNDSLRNVNLSLQDMRQECYIALMEFYARRVRENVDPYSYPNAYHYINFKRVLRIRWEERERSKKLINESTLEEDYDEGFSNTIKSVYDIDKKLDLEDILRKIYVLSLENDNVKMALLHAYLYESEKDIENGRAFKDYCREHFNTTDDTIWHRVKKGTEHIFFNDYKNISNYIHIRNLKNKFKFNDMYEELSEEDFGKEIAGLLDYYSGYTTCSICGKRFKPECDAVLGMQNPVCSDECRIIARKKLQERYRQKQGMITGTVIKICSICGKKFELSSCVKGQKDKNFYCSDECRKVAKRISHNEWKEKQGIVVGMITRTCAVCGKEFQVTSRALKRDKVYCSDECRRVVKNIYQRKFREQRKAAALYAKGEKSKAKYTRIKDNVLQEVAK